MFWQQIKSAEKFRKFGRKKILPIGSELDTKNYVAIVESGLCAVTTMTQEGNERTYIYFKPGNLVGYLRHVVPQEKFPKAHIYQTRNRITARTILELTLIKKEDFLRLIESDMECERDFTLSLAQNLTNLLEHSALVSCESAPIRICSMLMEFSEIEHGRSFMPICFTQNEMSIYLAMHTITVAKVLKALREAGYIRKEGRRIEIINQARLTEVVSREICIRY